MKAPVLGLAAAILLVSSCGAHAPSAVPSPSAAPAAAPATAPSAAPSTAPSAAPATTPSAAPAAAPSAADNLFSEGSSSLSHGNPEGALEAFSAAWQEQPGHAGVAAEFPPALVGLKRSADAAANAGRHEEAGKRYAAVLHHLPHPATEGKTLPFGKADVKSAMDRASESLMEKGLVEYRKGNLEAAVARWRAILAYDPSHEDAAKSVRTAQIQMKNLKKIPPPPPAAK